jgi:hypothetical protein
MIKGINYIFIIPPLFILIIALLFTASKILRGNYKAAFVGSAKF